MDFELNDTTEYQRCFACGLQNPLGLQMVFRREGETIVADLQPRAEFQGFPGVIHGGIIATILDEALNRTSLLTSHPAWTMTGRLEIRYRKYVPYGPLLRVRASIQTERKRMFQASGKLTLADDESTIFAEAQGTFLGLPEDVTQTLMSKHSQAAAFLDQWSEHK